jgi:transcriptional regulator with XRE-family HTH domain
VTLHVAFGLVVRRVRQQRGLSQEGLGFKSGLHRNYVGLIERGKRVPTLRTVERIAAGLGVSAADLVGQSEQLR